MKQHNTATDKTDKTTTTQLHTQWQHTPKQKYIVNNLQKHSNKYTTTHNNTKISNTGLHKTTSKDTTASLQVNNRTDLCHVVMVTH